MDQLFHLVHWWNISQTPRETKREFINLERKYHQECLIGSSLIAGGIWKGDILIADIEELEKFGFSRNISQKTECKRSPDNPKKENLYFLWQMVQQSYQGETTNSKNPL